ncbi:membrane protein [Caldimicrobium thiodismutans]|uniref:Membrane protein n=1 Tax=Caldimicrobium thiodismutans TaxID=1653476 RepID=A0A0U4W143_9BACT|nr:HPP family protein [Caldimicrobium thiodismutans]BAU22874.1 membrane protein [Caldimicrobium thiodismutans]
MTLGEYFSKMKGGAKSPPRVSLLEVFWSFVGSFLGIGLVAFIHSFYVEPRGLFLVIASYGASAVLIYGAPHSPLAQPRNLLGGHLLSGFVGALIAKLVPFYFLACALSVSLAIVVMHLTKTLHPPGGATALFAVIGGEKVQRLGLIYALFPVLTGAILMLIIALLVNNLSKVRRYPEYWW